MKQNKKLFIVLLEVFFGLQILVLSFNCILRPLKRVISQKKYENELYTQYKNESNWKKYDKNPVLGNITTGTLFDPYIIETYYENRNAYRMYVSNRSKGSIDCSISFDGVNFGELETCLESFQESGWENQINRASVLKKGDKYLMYYTGQTNDISRIGYAESIDGIHFERVQMSYILAPSENWEGSSVMNPCVLYDENENLFKMWYSAGETCEPDVICFATSKDGVNWVKYSSNPVFVKGQQWFDSCKVSCGQVIKNQNEYELFYIGYKDIYTASICHAVSNDGIHWNRDKKTPIIMSDKKGFDCDAVYKPTVIYSNDCVRVYYNGRNQFNEFIGMAEYRME